MKLRRVCTDLNLNIKDKYYILFLTCFSILITIIMVKFHQSRGAFNSDIYVYLASALDYAGMNYDHISDLGYMYNSPLICYLTSLLFKLGYVNVNSINLITAIFSFSGIYAMYIFLKTRFSSLLSLLGSLLYSSFSLTLFYYANGMLDVPAVSLIIWTFIFTVAAVNKNPKYYILVALFFTMSFFTRFTTIYIISLIVLYMIKDYDLVNLFECLKHDKIEFQQRIANFLKSTEFKWMVISTVIGFIIIFYVFYVILSYGAPFGLFDFAVSSVNKIHNPFDPNFHPDKLFYIKNYLSLLFTDNITSPMQMEKFGTPSFMAYLVQIILFSGFLIKFINIQKNKEIYKNNIKEIPFRNKNSETILKVLSVFFFVLAVISFKFNYLITLFLFWTILLIVQSLIKKYDYVDLNKFSLSLLCFGLFSFYIIIFSYMHLKCVRYILPTFPAFTYFVIYALNNILDFIRYGWEDENSINNYLKPNKSNFRLRLSQIIPIVIIIILLFTAFNFTNTVEIDELSLNFDKTANFLLDYDTNYQSKEIGVSPTDRYYDWYFNKDVDLIDPENFNTSYDYIFTYNLNNSNYHEIYRNGHMGVYEKN